MFSSYLNVVYPLMLLSVMSLSPSRHIYHYYIHGPNGNIDKDAPTMKQPGEIKTIDIMVGGSTYMLVSLGNSVHELNFTIRNFEIPILQVMY